MNELDDDNRYNFSHKYRGLALIIVNKYFKFHKKRSGASRDLQRMKEVFKKLGFKVKCYKDLTVQKMEEKFKNASQSVINKEADCFACVISSHGEEVRDPKAKETQLGAVAWRHSIEATDGRLFLESLLEDFQDDNCPDLAGKPKIFFIQACRSRWRKKAYDYGQSVTLVKASNVNNVKRGSGRQMGSQNNSVDQSDFATCGTVPEYLNHPQDTDAPFVVDGPYQTNSRESESSDYTDTSDEELSDDEWREEDDSGSEGDSDLEEETDTKGVPDPNPPSLPPAPVPKPLAPAQYDISPVFCSTDFLVMQAVLSGYLAMRNPTEGSWMLKYLYDNLIKMKGKKSLLQVLTHVVGDIATEYQFEVKNKKTWNSLTDEEKSNLPFKMVPCIEHMLTKDIYFTPKSKISKLWEKLPCIS